MTVAERVLGMWWCPRCWCNREFLHASWSPPEATLEGPVVPDLECWACGFVYGEVVREVDDHGNAIPNPRPHHVLTKEQRYAGVQRLRTQINVQALYLGIPERRMRRLG